MKKTKFLMTATLLLLLNGCGLFGDKEEDRPVYFEASETEYLAVPKGLNEPRRDQALEIMGERVAPGMTIDASSEPPRVQGAEGADVSFSGINYGAKGNYLLIDGSVGDVYSRLKDAIASTGMELLDENSAESSFDVYYADPPRPKPKKGFFKSMLFWKGNKATDYSGNYRTSLEADGDKTRIYLLNMQGQSTTEEAADVVLGHVLEGIG